MVTHKETNNITNKQIVEDFLHFLNNESGVINTDNYTYSYQELRNALISYHKETAAADKIKHWRITGYKGKNDYDGPVDNNIDITIAFDARFKKENVEDFMFSYWGKKYRSVAIKAEEEE